MYKVIEIADLFADACIRDKEGNLLFASLYGRDGALLQLMSAFTLKREEGGLDGFSLIGNDGVNHRISVKDVNQLDKYSGRLPKDNLFGNLVHTWLYDPCLTVRDYANRAAWVIDELDSSMSDLAAHRNDLAWEVIKDLSPIPLLEHWKPSVLEILDEQAIQPAEDTLYPPLGRITGFKVQLGDEFINSISTAVRTQQLLVDPEAKVDTSLASEEIRIAPVVSKAAFLPLPLGQVVMTPGVGEILRQFPTLGNTCLRRHRSGDWGCVGKHDQQQNDESLREGFRILSSYPIDPSLPCEGHGDNTLWIITESDRSVTTLLLPHEY